MPSTNVVLYFRHESGLTMPEPEASWESASFVSFASVEALQAAADVQGLKNLIYDGPEALFPACRSGTAVFSPEAEEIVWELACERSDDPEDATSWPPGYDLLRFLTFWRLPLMEVDARLELVEIH